jgi:hypothetical protein
MGTADFRTHRENIQARDALLDGSAFDDSMHRGQGRLAAEEILVCRLHDGQQGRIGMVVSESESPGSVREKRVAGRERASTRAASRE